MKRIIESVVVVTALLFATPSTAQMVIDNSLSAQELVQDVLVGQGVQVSNITFAGNPLQMGYFDAANTSFPIPKGVVISTGNVNDIPGPGSFFASSPEPEIGTWGPGDSDMNSISGNVTNDAAILQFEFVPTGDSVKFNFVFGSEEYPLYVNNINDAFAFIVSGPGFNGPFIDNGENIALIPGTNLPVTINNVNDVNPSNEQYYVNNENGSVNGVSYNGYTVSITALAEVICGETYTLRFVIADAFDGQFDSGVFLEAHSFSSNAVEVNITTATGPIEEGGGWIVENCTPAEIVFDRPPENADSSLVVPLIIEGSAINGVDYVGIPDTLFFEPGDTTLSFDIQALEDAFTEVGDSIVLSVYSINLCGDSTISTGTIHIVDYNGYDFSVLAPEDILVDCPIDSVMLVGGAIEGNPEYEFTWSNGTMGDTVWIVPQSDSLFVLTAVDACGTTSAPDTVEVFYNIQPEPIVEISGPTTFDCAGETVLLSASGTLGTPTYTYIWSDGGVGETNSITLNSDTVFYVSILDGCGVQSIADTLVITQNPVAVPTIQTSNDVTLDCPGGSATLTAIGANGEEPYSYLWNTSEVTGTITVQPYQTTDYIVVLTDDCYIGSVQDTITVTVLPYTAPIIALTDTSVICPGDLVLLMPEVENGNEPYTYSWSNGESAFSVSINPESTLNISVTMTDDCGNSSTDAATVDVPEYLPMTTSIISGVEQDADTLIICELWADTVWTIAGGGLPPYSYTWNGSLVDGMYVNSDTTILNVSYELPPDSVVTETYMINVVDQCGDEATAEIIVEAISCDIIQPSVFNTGSDFVGATDFCGNVPQNNVFNLACLELYPGNTVTIWDRWGRKCYKTEDYHLHPWDGGNHSTGVYYYVAEIPGGKEAVKGYFQLVK